MPRVSIITPAYNHAGYIRECIDSVVAGTFPDWEMLVVDDGSTDETAAVVAAYDDPRVRLLRKANGGIMRLAEGYNLALSHARGDLVAILEGDDHWPPDKLALQVPEFDDPAVVLVSGFAQMVDDEGNDLGRIPAELMPEAVRLNRPVSAATRAMLSPVTLMFTFPVATMMRRSALERIGGFRQPADLPLVDYPTFLALSLEGEFRFVEKNCGYWRRHPLSTTTSRLSDILSGCYHEGMRLVREESPRLALSDEDLDGVELVWEQYQALRCVLLGRMLAGDRRYRQASRAFKMADRFRQARRAALVARAAAKVAWLGLPVEWLYRLAYPNTPPDEWRESLSLAGDPIVRPSDVDHPWPVYRRHP